MTSAVEERDLSSNLLQSYDFFSQNKDAIIGNVMEIACLSYIDINAW